MFKYFKSCKVYEPVIGTWFPIELVEDIVLTNQLLGYGLAFRFEGDTRILSM